MPRPDSWAAEVEHLLALLPDVPATVVAGSNGCSVAARIADVPVELGGAAGRARAGRLADEVAPADVQLETMVALLTQALQGR